MPKFSAGRTLPEKSDFDGTKRPVVVHFPPTHYRMYKLAFSQKSLAHFLSGFQLESPLEPLIMRRTTTDVKRAGREYARDAAPSRSDEDR
jgi:hypothetical protein